MSFLKHSLAKAALTAGINYNGLKFLCSHVSHSQRLLIRDGLHS